MGFISTGRKKWNLCNRTRNTFEKRESMWLKSNFNFLESSDPLISQIRMKRDKKEQDMMEEALELIY